MQETQIHIKGARAHNLKNIDVKIPHGKITVITGVSGSGKSTLAFDTLYAEGQRRYVESLSSYARQFLGKLDKPEVDFIKGISPAIAIEQKVISTNPRSTVGTVTEIYDYLKLLFSRTGKTYSPISGEEVKKHTVTDVINFIREQKKETKLFILAPILNFEKYGFERQISLLKDQGYVRLLIDDEVFNLDDEIQEKNIHEAKLIVDRIKVDDSEDFEARISDSISLAFAESKGICQIYFPENKNTVEFNNRFELDGMEFVEPSEHFFTFNNPFGACKTCEGYGSVIGIDAKLVIPDPSLSVFQGAIAAWKGDTMSQYQQEFIFAASKFDFPIHRAISDLSKEEIQLLWEGNDKVSGLNAFFKFIESQTYKIQYRVMLSRYRGKTTCPDCKGTRLRKDANYVLVGGKTITDIVLSPIKEILPFFENLDFSKYDEKIAKRLLPEITNRLFFLSEVGLDYLTLNRAANSLSGGESQRINLSTSLGSSLVGSMYILDEPSIGLHPRDTNRLIRVLKDLCDLGNTVIIVEHEEEIMREADEIIDIGPKAGVYGGEIVFQGSHTQLKNFKNDNPDKESLTASYLNFTRNIDFKAQNKISKNKIILNGAYENNLKNVSVEIPLNQIVCVSGVSGSGKSSLIKGVLFPALKYHLGQFTETNKNYKSLEGDLKSIQQIEFIDQNPIGKSSRSNPVTYVKAYDDIRELYTRLPLAKARGYKPGFFSFNVEGGRCEMCEGEGEVTIGMQFMADVHLLCEVCEGKRFKQETLEVEYKGKNIADILEMDIASAYDFFKEGKDKLEEKITFKIRPLVEIGLGYLTMGQSSSTLSGGEAQRVKLASFLAKGSSSAKTLFIFDEPTTGLHFYDIEKLLIAFQKLIDTGNSIIVIEHNLDVIKAADWIIDIGPEGGNEGGNIVFEGKPDEITKCSASYTGQYLLQKLKIEQL